MKSLEASESQLCYPLLTCFLSTFCQASKHESFRGTPSPLSYRISVASKASFTWSANGSLCFDEFTLYTARSDDNFFDHDGIVIVGAIA